jgi:dipicolinate synthase subunit A
VSIGLNGIILKDDARYAYTENYLRRRGYILNAAYTPPENLDFIIFPLKEDIDKSIYDDAYFAMLAKKAQIFSGLRNTYEASMSEKHGLAYNVIMEDHGVTVENAVPTSEGVIAYLIGNRDDTIANSHILVIGYGVCGRDLAKRLKALGADVHALVRNREKAISAYADSISPMYLDAVNSFHFDVVVNTAPEAVLADDTITRAGGALFIDIASQPGFNMDLAKSLNEKSASLQGIPGKYAVRTAGEMIGEYVHFKLNGREAQ